MARLKGSKNKPKTNSLEIANNIPKVNSIFVSSEKLKEVIIFQSLTLDQTKTGGCIYENYCQKQIDLTGKNIACQNPLHCIEKLEGNCKLIIKATLPTA